MMSRPSATTSRLGSRPPEMSQTSTALVAVGRPATSFEPLSTSRVLPRVIAAADLELLVHREPIRVASVGAQGPCGEEILLLIPVRGPLPYEHGDLLIVRAEPDSSELEETLRSGTMPFSSPTRRPVASSKTWRVGVTPSYP